MRSSVWPRILCRFYSTPPNQPGIKAKVQASLKQDHDASLIRNIALVAHIDSGKTTLTESILHASSYIKTIGSVDTGSTTTDFLPAERERGITIQSASIPISWDKWTFNLIDTPGHADFGMEVESASRVVDGAVVLIDAVEGVEPQTEGVWRQLDRYDVQARIMFINKLDRPGSSFTSSLQSLLRHRLHPRPMVLNLPIASFDAEDYTRGEPGIQGLVDLIKWEVWKWDSNHNCSKHRLPRDVNLLNSTNIFPENHPLLVHLLPARHALLDNLSMTSDDFMNTMLDLPSDDPSAYLSLHADQIIPHLRNASLKNEALPVICGAAAKSIGTELLMNYIGELLPSPADLSHDEQDNKSILRVLAWKVGWDAKLGWLTFVRVYSGTLTKNAQLFNVTRKTKEQVGRLMLFYASEHRTVNSLSFGSVGVITGLKYTRTGDTLTAASAFASSFKLGDITAPPTLMSASVIPRSHSDLVRAEEALGALIRTDPSVRVENTEGQLIIHGVGALHLEIVAGRLKDEWGVNFELGVPRVSFREGAPPEVPMTPYTWKTDVAGVQVEIRISLAIRPLLPDEHGDPAWAGNVVTDANGIALPSPESTSSEELTLLARGIWSSLSNSPTTSLSMTGIHITLGECKWPSLPNPAVLSGAGAAALRECLQSVPMGPIMEPYVRLKVVVNEDNLGKVMRDLTDTASGEVIDLTTGQSIQSIGDEEHMPFTEDGVYIPPDVLSPSSVFRSGQPDSSIQGIKRTIHAIAPLSKMSDYASRLRSLSSGYGSFEMTSAGFRRVSESRKIDILAEIGYESRRARIL